MLMALAMLVSMVPMSAMAAECTFGQHDQLIALGTKCPICGEWGQKDEEPEQPDADVTPEQPEEDGKCTFGQHDQLIALGTKCPICGEWGQKDEESEQPDADIDPSAHKCMSETKAVANKDGLSHSIVCAECNEFWKNEAHNWEDGVCTACGFESPFESAPEKPEEDKKCTFGQHDQLMELGTKCPICGEWGKKDEQPDADVDPNAHKCMAETKAVATKDGLSHEVRCAKCDKYWKTVAHNWENGACVDCGFKSPFSTAPECEHEKTHTKQTIVEATCTEAGYIHHALVCNDCGEEVSAKDYPLSAATGHKWADGVCTVCGEESPFSTAPVAKHEGCYKPGQCNGVKDVFIIKAATCTKDGQKDTVYECGKLVSEVIPATGHGYKITKETKEYTKYACEDCGDSYVEYKHDHKPDHKPDNKPSWRPNFGSSLGGDYDNVPKTGNILSLILSFFGF